VAGGLKATIHNPQTSESAKESAEERLAGMQNEIGSAEAAEGGAKNTGNVVGECTLITLAMCGSNIASGGYKATISNPKTSEGAKQHARDVLHGYQKEGDLNDPDFVPED
ncbi:Conidiation-specific protein 6, partial [Leucoagaricus sp. SymC.cos]